eukprot:1133719-Pelagomonas_calceolata.AAC.1
MNVTAVHQAIQLSRLASHHGQDTLNTRPRQRRHLETGLCLHGVFKGLVKSSTVRNTVRFGEIVQPRFHGRDGGKSTSRLHRQAVLGHSLLVWLAAEE